MELEVGRTKPEKDKINKPETEDAELVHWKRLKIQVTVHEDDKSQRVNVRLDLRERLLDVDTKEAAIDARRVAKSLIHHMCRFTLEARHALFAERASNASLSEWIVSDSMLVSGLLHRLRREKLMPEMPSPPIPPGTKVLLSWIMKDVKGNLAAMNRFQDESIIRGQPCYGLFFFTSAWDSFGSRIIEGLDDPEAIRDLAGFFELSRAYGHAVPEAMKNWGGRSPTVKTGSTLGQHSPWAFFTYNHQTAIDTGERLRKRFEALG